MTPDPVPGHAGPARVVVVGAGLGGMAAACHLRVRAADAGVQRA
ncbi:MAG: hypothetical protein KatS3mg010_1707 [Acidimicrobiia bacterium]|nr:MAG: hypothetical protein KatS3mg010_1707 [Acidimicrobiia bacterium]